MTTCPPTPKSERPEDLGFTRKPMVGWFDPRQLLRTGIDELLSSAFGEYSDNREMQAVLQAPGVHDYSAEPELWLDYAADLGDGWDPTYSVAWLLSRPQLQVGGSSGITLPRGRILVMGGDQVYPAPEREEYWDRTEGPYRAALPCVPDGVPPDLYAIPGNHDWYDGLTGFSRLFCQGRWIGGWQTRQRRSYFAIKLPHRWWIWGIDIQLRADIDKPQLDYFSSIARDRLQPGDRVILCTAKPSWVYSRANPRAHRSLSHFVDRLIRDHGAKPLLTLAGDLHHYARYREVEGRGQKITSGGGGAYLAATHDLPAKIDLPEAGGTRRLARAKTFPSGRTSRLRTFGALLFPLRNPKFAAVLGAFYLLSAWLLQSASKANDGTLLERLAGHPLTLAGAMASLGDFVRVLAHSPGSTLLFFLVVAAFVAMTEGHGRGSRWSLGFVSGALHVVLIFVLIGVFAHLNLAALGLPVDAPSQVVLFGAEMLLIGGLAGGFLMGVFFAASSLLFHVNTNVAFSCQRIPDYKNFLRIHLDQSGRLTVYPVGIRRVARKWRFNPGAKNGEAWFTPGDGTIPVELIEPPITLGEPVEPAGEASDSGR